MVTEKICKKGEDIKRHLLPSYVEIYGCVFIAKS